MHDLAKHTNTILTIMGGLFTVVTIFIMFKLNTIKGKIEMNSRLYNKCREELPRKFVSNSDFIDYRQDLKEGQGDREGYQMVK